MKATTPPKAEKVESDSTPRRTMRDRLFAHFSSNPRYWAGWADGAIFGGALCAIGMALLGATK